MAHKRKSIRENIVSELTGLATTGTNVFESRVYPIQELPGICVYTLEEESEYRTVKPPRNIRRELVVAIEVYVKARQNYDDTIDQISSEIEDALTDDIKRGGHAQDTRIISMNTEFSAEGEQHIAIMTLTVGVTYFTNEGSPEQ